MTYLLFYLACFFVRSSLLLFLLLLSLLLFFFSEYVERLASSFKLPDIFFVEYDRILAYLNKIFGCSFLSFFFFLNLLRNTL